KEEMPSIRPIPEPLGQLPKASTFYAGARSGSGQHVYFYFQHANKAWWVGRFTINVVLASDPADPQMVMWNRFGSEFGEGYYRISFLVGEKDKWWHLKADGDPIITQAWRPSQYGDLEAVLREAVDDVTRDVFSVTQLLGVVESKERGAEPGSAAKA